MCNFCFQDTIPTDQKKFDITDLKQWQKLKLCCTYFLQVFLLYMHVDNIAQINR